MRGRYLDSYVQTYDDVYFGYSIDQWSDKPLLHVVCLSTAAPHILRKRCVKIADQWGHGGVIITPVCGLMLAEKYVSQMLGCVPDRSILYGRLHSAYTKMAVEMSSHSLCAWGRLPRYAAKDMLKLLRTPVTTKENGCGCRVKDAAYTIHPFKAA